MKIGIEVVKDSTGKVHELRPVPADSIYEAAPNKAGVKYVQCLLGKPVAAFTAEELFILEFKPVIR